MTKLRLLFAELPYAAALTNDDLLRRCSTCFAENAQMPCGNGCSAVVYCNERCHDRDRICHQYECVAFKNSNAPEIDHFVRLLGRILTRRLSDRGFARLSENFPETVTNRWLGDLMTHQSAIEKHPVRNRELSTMVNKFQRFFESTPLIDELKIAREMYCAMIINCFTISGSLKLHGRSPSPGVALYLNVSRFNHSCRPDLFVQFDGCRLLVKYPSTAMEEKNIDEERSYLTQSEFMFDWLTISYGFGRDMTNDSHYPLRSQRRAFLEYGYFFVCKCTLCNDEHEAELEENAAVIECDQCRKPFVWQKVIDPRSIEPRFVCRKSCACSMTEKEARQIKSFVDQPNHHSKLALLEVQWTDAISGRLQNTYANEVIERCEPVLEIAQSLWHRSKNVRLAQLKERLFVGYISLINSSVTEEGVPNRVLVKRSLQLGEEVLVWYKRHTMHRWDAVVATFAFELASFYKMAAHPADLKNDRLDKSSRACEWYLFSASIFDCYGDEASLICKQLRDLAGKLKASCGSSDQLTIERET